METQSRYDNIEIVNVSAPKLTIESNPATIQFEYKFICMETHNIDTEMYALFGRYWPNQTHAHRNTV